MKHLKHDLGLSVLGKPLVAHEFPARTRKAHGGCVLVLGGFHGDEPKSVYVVERLIEQLTLATDEAWPSGKHGGFRWVLLPVVNPDGLARRKRRNANKVDLNRNLPTQNWEVGNPRSRMFGGRSPASEPETRAVIRAMERFRPDAIISIHSINRNRFCNNFDGPGQALARQMSRHNGYPVTSSIGYPTPGSFGTWAGAERGIPTITLELPSHHSAPRCWEANRYAILDLTLER